MIICKFEDGGSEPLRHVVADNLVINNDKILLVKRALHLTNPRKYALPGGFIQRDETIKEGVTREIMEETGYKVKIECLFRIKDSPKRPQEDRQNILFVFLASSLEKTGHIDNESTEIKWFDLNNFPDSKEFAFDHYEDIQLYLQHLKKPFSLPLFK